MFWVLLRKPMISQGFLVTPSAVMLFGPLSTNVSGTIMPDLIGA
jgi:hypothetical protein